MLPKSTKKRGRRHRSQLYSQWTNVSFAFRPKQWKTQTLFSFDSNFYCCCCCRVPSRKFSVSLCFPFDWIELSEIGEEFDFSLFSSSFAGLIEFRALFFFPMMLFCSDAAFFRKSWFHSLSKRSAEAAQKRRWVEELILKFIRPKDSTQKISRDFCWYFRMPNGGKGLWLVILVDRLWDFCCGFVFCFLFSTILSKSWKLAYSEAAGWNHLPESPTEDKTHL